MQINSLTRSLTYIISELEGITCPVDGQGWGHRDPQEGKIYTDIETYS